MTKHAWIKQALASVKAAAEREARKDSFAVKTLANGVGKICK